jgi:response regulator of citrate/malate metabolism
VAASKTALNKGGLRSQGIAHLTMGMAYFNIGDYQHSIEQLNQAQKYERSRGTAQQWAKYVETQRSTFARIQSSVALSDS